MGGGLLGAAKNFLFGSDDGGEPHVQSTFSNRQESVMNLLNETITNIETSITSTTTASNNAGKVNIVATKGSKIKIDLSQNANVQAAQAYMSMITMLMKSDANTDVKLDALASVCQAVKNDGNIMQSPETAQANIQLETENLSNVSNIQKLNQDLKLAVATCAVNNFEGGNFLADDESEIDFKLNQQADAISDNLIQMVTDEKSTLSDTEKNELKSQIEADNKAEGTGIVAGIGHEVGDTARNISDNTAKTVQKVSDDVSSAAKSSMTLIVAAIAVPIVLIILIVGIILIYKVMSGNGKKGEKRNENYSDDDDDMDDDDMDDDMDDE